MESLSMEELKNCADVTLGDEALALLGGGWTW